MRIADPVAQEDPAAADTTPQITTVYAQPMARCTPAIPQSGRAACPARSIMDHLFAHVRFRPLADIEGACEVSLDGELL